jgi:hypothetical protein
MTMYIAPIAPSLAVTECAYVSSAKSAYDTADAIVNSLENTKKRNVTSRRNNMNLLKASIQSIENNIWEALARDYPKFKFRRQNQTIIVNYGSSNTIYVNPGEIYKISSWGVNDYYEALDTVNRLQAKLWNDTSFLTRNWKDDWKRLDKQLNAIDRRNCKNNFEPKPGPIVILPPPCLPRPPNPPGPIVPIYPCPPIPSQLNWSTLDKRNWSLIGWNIGDVFPAVVGYTINRPSLYQIDGREFVFYKTPGTTPTRLLWLFHGAGGSARSWFTDYEKVLYVKKFVDAGYAVCAYDSYNRISKKWTPTADVANNRELSGLKACRALMSNLNLVPSVNTSVSSVNPYTGISTVTTNTSINIPQYGAGMSAGGGFVSYAAQPLGLQKIAIHNATGFDSVIRNASYDVKTLWMLSNSDIIVNNTEALNNYNYLQANKPSLTVGYYNQQPTKMTAAIFDAIPEISTVVANAIITGLTTNSFIDGSGNILSKYTSAGRTLREQYIKGDIPAIISTAFGNDQATCNKFIADIMDQIKISFSDHEFSGWQRTESAGSLVLVERDLAFFNS